MGTNAAALIGLGLGHGLQGQAYHLAVVKANAEGRDVTDEEVAAAKAEAMAAIDALAKA